VFGCAGERSFVIVTTAKDLLFRAVLLALSRFAIALIKGIGI
jgi:hypothetical protein